MTARHCVDDGHGNVEVGEIIKYTVYADSNTYVAKVSHFTKNSDIAILTSVNDVDHSIARLSSGTVPVGLNVHIIGHPVGLQWTYITGVVSAIRDIKPSFVKRKFKTIHIASLVMRGNSGGGAFDNNGTLLGVASFMITDRRMPSPGMSFFVHRDVLIDLLNEKKIKYYRP